MGKIVKAVAPFHRKGIIDFKKGAYDAWLSVGGKTATTHYPPNLIWGWFYNHELPSFPKSKYEARLRFIEPITRKQDAFPDYMRYEIIPMIWDCWPCLDNRISSWITKHQIKTAIFTSQQNAERIQKRFPQMNILVVTEGIDSSKYLPGKNLAERKIDLLEFGRSNENVLTVQLPSHIRHICTRKNGKYIYSDEELFLAMSDAKLTISLPRCDTDPKIAGNVETLTQRYWENMLSRIVMVGRAPSELINYIGYNPVIPLDNTNANEQIRDILSHIDDYQELVDRNRETALRMAPWDIRMKKVMDWLQGLGYNI